MVTLVWPAALGLLTLVLAGWLLGRRRAPRPGAVPVAGSAWVAYLPAVRRRLRRYRALRVIGTAMLVVAAVGAAVLAARPVDREVRVDRLGSRDIVLCLDVSGSMRPYDTAILRSFARLVDSFAGERIALSVFDSTSRTVLPLTDDYTVVLQELDAAAEALAFDLDPTTFDSTDGADVAGLDRLSDFLAGTSGVPDQTSLIGDGLAACALQLDEQQSVRSRSIILATDNEVAGVPLYTLPQAVDLVVGRGVSLVGLDGGDPDQQASTEAAEFRTAVADADGLFFTAGDPSAIDGIVADVQSQQAVDLDSSPHVVDIDRQQPWFGLLAVGVVVLVLTRWRSRT